MIRSLLRLGFRLLYHELAFTYDWVSRGTSIGQWRMWQRAGLRRLRGNRVLELAHGTGDMLLDMLALGFEPVGLDLSPTMGRIASRKLSRHGVTAPLVRGRAQALPFATEAFTSVLSTFPAEFIGEPAVLAELRRVLGPGGRVVVVPVARITGLGPLDRLGEWLFHITGQSDPRPLGLTAPLDIPGFDVRIEVDRLERSEVMVVVGEKRGEN